VLYNLAPSNLAVVVLPSRVRHTKLSSRLFSTGHGTRPVLGDWLKCEFQGAHWLDGNYRDGPRGYARRMMPQSEASPLVDSAAASGGHILFPRRAALCVARADPATPSNPLETEEKEVHAATRHTVSSLLLGYLALCPNIRRRTNGVAPAMQK
jgi:hypothetical protein